MRYTLAVLLFVTTFAVPAGAQDRCAGAKDLVQSSLGRLPDGANEEQLRAAIDGLRRATQLCPGMGDAYYYLSLIGEQLKDPRTEGWRRQARVLGSAASQNNATLAGAGTSTEPTPAGPAPATTAAASENAVPASTTVSPYVRRKLALVVAARKFRDTQINELAYTTADGRAFAAALGAMGFDSVKTLFDEEATTYRIKTEIDRLAKEADAEDLVVIYFASHGSPDNLDTAGVNYIVTYDTEVTNLYATAYRMDELADDIGNRIKAERVVAFLDTCYSGGTFKALPTNFKASSRSVASARGLAAADLQARITGARGVVLKPSEETAPRTKRAQGVGRVIITASGQAERSWEDPSIQHGYFTFYLLEALNAPGSPSIEDVFSQVRVKVTEAVRTQQNQSQSPTIARTRDRVDLYLRDTIGAATSGPAPAARATAPRRPARPSAPQSAIPQPAGK